MKRQEMSKGQRVMAKLHGSWREGWLMEPRTMAVVYERQSPLPGQGRSGLMRRMLAWSSTGAEVGYPVMMHASGLVADGELPALCGKLVRGQDIEDWDAFWEKARAAEAEKLRLESERERNIEAMRERASRLPLSASQMASLTWVAESWRPAATEPSGRLTMTIGELERFAEAVLGGPRCTSVTRTGPGGQSKVQCEERGEHVEHGAVEGWITWTDAEGGQA